MRDTQLAVPEPGGDDSLWQPFHYALACGSANVLRHLPHSWHPDTLIEMATKATGSLAP